MVCLILEENNSFNNNKKYRIWYKKRKIRWKFQKKIKIGYVILLLLLLLLNYLKNLKNKIFLNINKQKELSIRKKKIDCNYVIKFRIHTMKERKKKRRKKVNFCNIFCCYCFKIMLLHCAVLGFSFSFLSNLFSFRASETCLVLCFSVFYY